MSIPISQQKGYNNTYARYWTKPVLEINGNHYILCSQWFEEFRGKIDEWIGAQNWTSIEQETNVYVLPKNKIKICSKCGNKTQMDKLLVTHYKGDENFQHMLHIRKCDICGSIYMSDGTLKMYKNTSDKIDASINFIEKDT